MMRISRRRGRDAEKRKEKPKVNLYKDFNVLREKSRKPGEGCLRNHRQTAQAYPNIRSPVTLGDGLSMKT